MLRKSLLFLLLCVTQMLTPLFGTSGQTFLSQKLTYQQPLAQALLTTHHHRSENTIFKGTLSINGFYEHALSNEHVGRYFGDASPRKNYNGIYINNASSVAAGSADQINNYLVRVAPGNVNNKSMKLNLAPSYRAFGAGFTYVQQLPFLFSNTTFSAHTSYVTRTNYLNYYLSDTSVHSPGALLNYLHGTYESATAGHAQSAVQFAKLSQEALITTQLSDVELALHHKMLSLGSSHVHLGIGGIVPTTSSASGAFLYRPQIGNNGHWALFGDLTCDVHIWKEWEKALALKLSARYQYSFAGTEQRTIGLQSTLTQSPYGQYILLAHKSNGANAPLLPAANLLTQNMTIKPGQQIDGTILLSYQRKSLLLDLGYQLSWFEKEKLYKSSIVWENDTYALPGPNFDTRNTVASQTAKLNNFTTSDGAAHQYLQLTDLDENRALTPAHSVHTLWLGAGIQLKRGSSSFMLGSGISAQLGDKKFVANPISIWLKIGISL